MPERVTAQHLQLVKQPAGPLDRGLVITPVGLYITSLAESARRPALSCLRRAARLMGAGSADEITWEAMRFAHVEMLKERMRKTHLAPSTINATLCVLRGVAREAWRLKLIETDDYQRLKDVKGVRGERVRTRRALSGDELEALIGVCERDSRPAGARDLCLIALLAGGGLRRAEAVALDLENYDERSHALKVRGKGNKERTVYFSDGGARRAIRRWLRVRGGGGGPLLCPVSKTGSVALRRMSAQAVYKILERRARRAGLRRFSPHDLRRTFASDLLGLGADISAVQQLLGHASVETTVLYDMRGEDSKRAALRLRALPFRVRRKRSPHKSKRRRRKFRRGEYRP
jgi:site-specific recombinase XerD